MESSVTPVTLLLEVIRDHSPVSKWTDAPLEKFRHVENTNRGEIGEEFIRRFLRQHGIKASNGSRLTPTDLRIFERRLEVKTASEDKGGSFQFNHIRHDRSYDYLLCLGISPAEILFNAWSKGTVAEGKAGRLVRMAEGQSVTFKLTKRKADMLPIEELPGWLRSNLQGGKP